MTSVSLSSSTYSLHEPVQAKEQAGVTTTNINDWMPVAPLNQHGRILPKIIPQLARGQPYHYGNLIQAVLTNTWFPLTYGILVGACFYHMRGGPQNVIWGSSGQLA